MLELCFNSNTATCFLFVSICLSFKETIGYKLVTFFNSGKISLIIFLINFLFSFVICSICLFSVFFSLVSSLLIVFFFFLICQLLIFHAWLLFFLDKIFSQIHWNDLNIYVYLTFTLFCGFIFFVIILIAHLINPSILIIFYNK